VANEHVIRALAEGFRNGLPHPGNRDKHQSPQIIHMPGMNFHGLPKEVLDRMAAEAGLPTTDLPTLIAEAVVNLIETVTHHKLVAEVDYDLLNAKAAEVDVLKERIAELEQQITGRGSF